MNVNDIKNLGLVFWILVLNCALIYGSFFTFTSNVNDFLNKVYGVPNTTAGSYISIIFICSAVITPFFGAIIDRVGKAGHFMLYSLILFLGSHILFLNLPTDVDHTILLIPLVMMGLFYATYAAVFWPCIPLVVEKKLVGTAYGIVKFIM